MAYSYVAGEKKDRPGVYQRYSKADTAANGAGALNGVVAFVTNANWGPLNKVTVHTSLKSLKEQYGTGSGIDVAEKLFEGGATKVYVYRPEGTTTAGVAGTIVIGGVTATAKYPGTKALKVKVSAKVGDATTKVFQVIDGTTVVETFEFAVNETDEGAGLVTATANSAYVTVTKQADGQVDAGEYALAGGADPVITTEDYVRGFYALEPYRYNVIATDTITTNSVIAEYVKEAYNNGKLVQTVIGCASSDTLVSKQTAAKANNSKQVIYLGVGYKDVDGNDVDEAKAAAYAAGAIAATPSTESIVHKVINGATDVIVTYTNEEYTTAIQNGVLLISLGPDGEVWFDSGVNTLVTPGADEDDGWKKIRRVKTRFELMDRIDRTLAPKVGKINGDGDGKAYIIQSASGVIKDMIAERKLSAGSFYEDPEAPASPDSAYFIIEVDDIDSLEKIYLHYKYRFTAEA